LNPQVPRVPLLSGTRIVVASAPADARVLRPPAPGRATDVDAATREALRFPLDGEPLEAIAARASRATIVVEPPALPIGNVLGDPRRSAIAAVSQALEELGVRGIDLDTPRPSEAGGIPEHRVGALRERGVGAAECRGACARRHLEEGEAGRVRPRRCRGAEDQDQGERRDLPRVVHGISGIGR